jgi:cysteine desulfurase/selenocysteine lyase
VHRGAYLLSEEATSAREHAREIVAAFFHARNVCEVVFVRNTTEGVNLVASSWGYANIHAGDVILLTEMEHHSNIVPWQLLAERTGAVLRFVPVLQDGTLNIEAYERLLEEKPKLVGCMHISNVLGTINPIKSMIASAHRVGAVFLLDAAQSAPHTLINVQELDVDFLTCSGHKMLAPTGIGVLYGKQSLLSAMPPYMGGGDMIRQVFLDHSTWNDLPYKFEAGTPAIAEAIGLGVAIDYLQAIGLERITAYEQELSLYTMEKMQTISGLHMYGPAERAGLISFTLDGIHPHDLATILDEETSVAIRAGHHCAMPLHNKLGVAATARISFYLYTTKQEIDMCIQGLIRAKEIFHV